MFKITTQTKLLGIILPIATAITLYVLLAAGALPQIGGMPDIITFVLELAPRTLYAIAIGGVTAFSMHACGMNIGNTHRSALMRRAEDGDDGARHALTLEAVCWFGWAVFWLLVFRPWA